MLSWDDELPVHQTPHPLRRVADSSPGFDDGYFIGVFSPDEQIFCFTGLRVTPNAGMIGGYAGVNRAGQQRTLRFSRPWDPQRSHLRVGPYEIEVVEPFRTIRLRLDDNDSGLAFDLTWQAAAPAFEEAHHLATLGGRVVTDQTRYAQPGRASGWLTVDGERITVDPQTWGGSRDHSWGLYFERPPLAPDPALLPPVEREGVPRALRFWTLFSGDGLAGFYAIHEDPTGRQVPMNDTFGTPFEGRVDEGVDGPGIAFVAGRHELTFRPGTRLLERATIHLTDADGRAWVQHVRPAAPPWVTATIGYQGGSWRDGGSMRTYHGSGTVVEWDQFDFSEQPIDHQRYDGTRLPGLIGKEYVSRTETIGPDGRRYHGAGHTELFLDGPFSPYGFES